MNKKSLNKTLAILLVAIIGPIAVFLYIQLINLRHNETMLEEARKNQLNAVLFSVNQYSDDVMKSLLFKLENVASIPKLTYEEVLPKYPGIREIAIVNERNNMVQLLSGTENHITRKEVEQMLQYRKSTFDKLKEYKDVGFSKLEPLSVYTSASGEYNLLTFVIEDPWEDKSVCILLIDPDMFITKFLSPKMQELATNSYVVTASKRSSGELVVATDSTDQEKQETRAMWLLPEYNLNITMQGESAASIARDRFRINLILTVSLVGLLALGFVLLARNMRKDMQLTQLKADFVSNVSHEIRTPLALINMFAETLMMDRVKTEDKKKEYYSIIVKETSRLRNIVNKILNFSQLETGRRSYNLGRTCLNNIVKETIASYSYHLENNGFTYATELAVQLPPVLADPEAITEALVNLIDNAMKYSREQKHIVIATGSTETQVFASVTDQGIGISAADRKLIFDKFFRVTSGDIYQVAGAGLGLSITRQIMEAHNGEIKLKSEPGKGSTFLLYFPIKS